MEPGFIDLTAENIADQHLCCIIRSKKPHPGVEAKRRWLVDRLPEGHVFRKLDVKEKVFIEYAPLETAWSWFLPSHSRHHDITDNHIRINLIHHLIQPFRVLQGYHIEVSREDFSNKP